MNKKTYADQCLERALITDGKHPNLYKDVPELARRLKLALAYIEANASGDPLDFIEELEAPLEGI